MLTLLSGYGFDEEQGPYLMLDELGVGHTRRRRAFVCGAPLSLTATAQHHCIGTLRGKTRCFVQDLQRSIDGGRTRHEFAGMAVLGRTLVALFILFPCALVTASCNRPRKHEGTRLESSQKQAESSAATTVYALTVNSLEGKPVRLSEYRGQVSLLVNVASKCGYTPQYEGLQRLYEKYKARGFAVLGFPSNDFGEQEPGAPEQIREFCSSKYRVTFPMFQKVQTKAGPGQSEVYARLARASGSLPSWNFGKYLLDRSGQVLKVFNADMDPESPELVSAIEAALDTH
jgi:glutathione peroxidase